MSSDELIFGRNAVLSFLEAQDSSSQQHPSINVNKIMIAQGLKSDARLDTIITLAKRCHIPLYRCHLTQIDQILGADRRHQGIVAFLSPTPMWQLATLLEKLKLEARELALAGKSLDGYIVAVADGIEDPHNLGAIIRVAEASGVKALIIRKRRASPVTGTVAKTSAGAVFTLPIVCVPNLSHAIESLKKHGFWAIGLDASADKLYTEADLKRPLCIVIGNEGFGLSRLVKHNCDFLLKIPMLGKIQSLNASVAAGILFYEAVRQNR